MKPSTLLSTLFTQSVIHPASSDCVTQYLLFVYLCKQIRFLLHTNIYL